MATEVLVLGRNASRQESMQVHCPVLQQDIHRETWPAQPCSPRHCASRLQQAQARWCQHHAGRNFTVMSTRVRCCRHRKCCLLAPELSGGPSPGRLHPFCLHTLCGLPAFDWIPTPGSSWRPPTVCFSPSWFKPVRTHSGAGVGINPTEIKSGSRDIFQGEFRVQFY